MIKTKPLITQKKFSGFFWTQFLGAFNDNAFKQGIVFMITFKLTETLPKETADFYVSLGAGLFILPYILFSSWAATWTDRIGKTKIIVSTKVMEIGVMGLGFIGFYLLDPKEPKVAIWFLLVTLFLMGTQSTLFSPAKYGIIPELVEDSELTDGNGWLEMGTFVSILLGTFTGGWLVEWFGETPHFMSIVFLVISIIGWWASLQIPLTSPVNPQLKYTLFFPRQIARDFRKMKKKRVVFLTVMGISVFWFFGAVFLIILPGFGKFVGASAAQTNFLMIAFSVGIGLGSMWCGRLSDGKVEMGLIPFGALGITLFSLTFGFWYPSQVSSWADLVVTYLDLIGLGIFGGFFIVPLNALLQQRTTEEERASMIALNNIINSLFMVVSSGFVLLGRSALGLNEPQLVQIMALLLILGAVYTCYLLPEFLIRFLLWMLTHFIYPIETFHRERIPPKGPVLLVANHLSFLDAFLVQMSTHRPIRFIIDRQIYNLPIAKSLFQLMGAIPIYSRRYAEQYEAAFAQIKQQLDEGEVICIFPEGQISRTGQTFQFKAGMERILQETPCPVVPISISGIWGSLLSYSGNRFFKKRPMVFQHPITVIVGHPLPPTTSGEEARQIVQNLGMEAIAARKPKQKLLHQQVLRQARKRPFRTCVSDEEGRRWSYGGLCRKAKTLAWQIQRKFDETTIGLALPTSTEAVLLNLAMAMAGKTVVNLNLRVSDEQLQIIVRECGLQTVIAPKTIPSWGNKSIPLQWITPDSLQQSTRMLQHCLATLEFYALPAHWQHRHQMNIDQTLAIVYTPGIRGAPKGVRWTHYNLISNIQGFMELVLSDSRETLISSLPLYYGYGLNVACWLPLLTGIATVYPSDSQNAERLAHLIQNEKATVLAESPELLSSFAREASSESLGVLKYIISGGSALPSEIITLFQKKWKIEVLEGYGAAECAPLIAVNVPSSPIRDYQPLGHLPGSLGRPIPGIAVKILDAQTQKPCPVGTPGIIWVGGASVTSGYIGAPANASDLLQDGWFCTEDEGFMDEDGFLFLVENKK